MKFINGNYNSTTGRSIVVLMDKQGNKYVGSAKLHPDDRDKESKYVGCDLAEKRALIQALKSKRSRIKIKLETIYNLIDDLCYNIPDKLPYDINKRLYFKVKDYTKQIVQIDETIEEIRNEIKKRI